VGTRAAWTRQQGIGYKLYLWSTWDTCGQKKAVCSRCCYAKEWSIVYKNTGCLDTCWRVYCRQCVRSEFIDPVSPPPGQAGAELRVEKPCKCGGESGSWSTGRLGTSRRVSSYMDDSERPLTRQRHDGQSTGNHRRQVLTG
jgi:hypothetical protein